MTSIALSQHVAHDAQSHIRGLGRYVTALGRVVESISSPPDTNSGTYIEPFFNPITQPLIDLAMIRSKRRIAVVHDAIPLTLPQFPWMGTRGKVYLEINKRLLRLYHSVITDSEASRVSIISHLSYPSERIRVIYPYSPLQSLEVTASSALPYGLERNGYFVYVGDVNWHKNIVPMAHAARQLGVRLVCVGGAFLQTDTHHPWYSDLDVFKSIARESAGSVMCVGYVDDMTLAHIYAGAIANLLLSFDEGFGYSYIEAGHFHTPSILSDIPVLREISDHKGAVFVQDFTNPSLIARAMQELKDDRITRDALGHDAHLQSTHYSFESFREAWILALGGSEHV